MGYEELSTKFKTLDAENNANEFNKWLPNIKRMVVDANVVAQEQGLNCAFSYLENAPNCEKYYIKNKSSFYYNLEQEIGSFLL